MFHSRMRAVGAVLLGIPLLALAPRALAHCDTLDGPVAAAAREALGKGDVTPVLRWVRPADEAEIRTAFGDALAARKASPEARTLADRWFLETLVRVHRAGEGAPYTGLKPAGELSPALAAADRALESGSPEALVKLLTDRVSEAVRSRFARVAERRKGADESVEKGRRFVEAYVLYVHTVEAIEQAAGKADAHGASHEHQHSN